MSKNLHISFIVFLLLNSTLLGMNPSSNPINDCLSELQWRLNKIFDLRHGGDDNFFDKRLEWVHDTIAVAFNKIKPLIDQDRNYVNMPNSLGDTPLHLAAKIPSESLVKLLLFNGADRMAMNKAGKCPIDYAKVDTGLIAELCYNFSDELSKFVNPQKNLCYVMLKLPLTKEKID